MNVRRIAQPPGQEALLISVRAKPRSPRSALELESAGTWIARLRSSPVDGKANAELVRLVASQFGCSRSLVSVVCGASARLKRVRIEGGSGREATLAGNPTG